MSDDVQNAVEHLVRFQAILIGYGQKHAHGKSDDVTH